jgi:RimJ/RimL family protein N-acetyltransferase
MTGVLTGELIRLRELRDADLPLLVEWWQDEDVAALQNSGPVKPRPADGLAELFRSWSRNTDSDVGLSIVDKQTGEFAGHVSLHGVLVAQRCATLGIVLGPPFQNRGFGTDTVRTIVRYGFTEMGLHRIQLNVNGDNERAVATYRKCGFVEEGRAREFMMRHDRWYDLIQMGILDHEWRAAQPG